jgi:RNA polymerase-associated protein RTF1
MFHTYRMKESERNNIASKKRKADSNKKAAAAKKSKKLSAVDDELARALSDRRESGRNRDAKQAKSKKVAALAALKREKLIQQQQTKMDGSSDDESLDFGDDEDDSDDDYEEGGLKPWQQKKTRSAREPASRAEKEEESDDDMDIDDDELPNHQQQKKSRKKAGGAVQPREEVEATREDFLKCTIPRRRLARWCNEPFFEAAVLECFVRLFIGEDKGEKCYRLCEIVEVKHGETYMFPVTDPKKDKPVSTNIMLTLKFGKSVRDFPMFLVSDVAPDDSDVRKYIINQKNERLEILTKRRAIRLRRVQDELVMNYTYTTEDIERNLQKRRKQGKSLANFSLEQTRTADAVQAANEAVLELQLRIKSVKSRLLEASGRDVPELEADLKHMEADLQVATTQLEEKENEQKALQDLLNQRKSKLSLRTKDRSWAKVNERALQANQLAGRELTKEKKDDVTASGTKKVEFNPFARRRVKPKVLWDVGQDAAKDEAKQEVEAKGDEKKEDRDEAPVDEPVLVREARVLGVALGDSHQFTIDEEGIAHSSSIGFTSGRTKKAVPSRPRNGLSLKDYMERKAQGIL